MTVPPVITNKRGAALFGLPPWMSCYILLGFVQSGLVPVILPLAAAPGPTAGLTYAAFAATGLAAPFIGAWSDRHRRHKWTLAGGLGLAGLALLAHRLPGGTAQHMASAALIGLGVSSASTVATMFIVEVVPEARWDGQIGALQACLGGGQLFGLLTAGMFGLRHLGDSFLLGAGLMAAGVPLALAFGPDPVVKVERSSVVPRAARGGEAAAMGAQRSFHRATWRAVGALRHNSLTWFLAAWLVSYTATNGLSVMLAVAMVREYHTAATLPTTAYAAGVGCGLLLYRVVGGWDARYGARLVLGAGLAARAALVGGMTLLAPIHTGMSVMAMLFCFAGTQVAWPLLSVASTRLSVTLSPAHRAESVGLLNATTSLGAMVGGVFGGLLVRPGFVWLCAAVLAALVVALLLVWHPRVRLNPA